MKKINNWNVPFEHIPRRGIEHYKYIIIHRGGEVRREERKFLKELFPKQGAGAHRGTELLQVEGQVLLIKSSFFSIGKNKQKKKNAHHLRLRSGFFKITKAKLSSNSRQTCQNCWHFSKSFPTIRKATTFNFLNGTKKQDVTCWPSIKQKVLWRKCLHELNFFILELFDVYFKSHCTQGQANSQIVTSSCSGGEIQTHMTPWILLADTVNAFTVFSDHSFGG